MALKSQNADYRHYGGWLSACGKTFMFSNEKVNSHFPNHNLFSFFYHTLRQNILGYVESSSADLLRHWITNTCSGI